MLHVSKKGGPYPIDTQMYSDNVPTWMVHFYGMAVPTFGCQILMGSM